MTLKRLVAPNWPIEKKTKKFVVEPRPGPHSSAGCMPLGVVVRDVTKFARTMNEARQILNSGSVRVDGVVRKERGFPVGFMDVVSMGDENYRAVVGAKGLTLEKIKHSEAGTKLLRVENKVHVSGKTQLNFHDGRNMLVDKDSYKTGDVVVFDLSKKTVKEAIRMEKGSLVLVIGGNNTGSVGKISDIIITRSSKPNQVAVDLGEKTISLPKNYIFVLGKDSPAVSLGEKR